MLEEESRLKKGRQKAATEGGERLVRGRGLGEVGVGSARSVLKVKRGEGGGVYAALRSKNWKKESCVLISLKSRRETGESQPLRGLWHYKPGPQAVCSTD